ncbi:RHS repeat-associated core domain-containing protein [Escherichia coli]|uniref:RHS repeat-associated core domain-containing protein n=1 Tax=Escherichia coli TaxID=562 RepID=UPI000F182ACD|nr:RHS repeat-associated core domain-containing protein [Escherichia coli]VCV30239.1 Putative deoxyribonuclease RhsC [Escherichia coli]
MSGKPAARQGDMTQYGGSIVQGSAGVRIGAPTGVACSVCPGGVTSGHPVNPLLGAKVLPGETDIALPGPLPFILSRTYSSYRTKTPAPVGSLGPGWKMPADIRLQLRDNTLILSDNGGRSLYFEHLFPGEDGYSRSESLWLVRGGVAKLDEGHRLAALWQALPEELRLSPHRYLATNSPQGPWWLLGWCERVPEADEVLPAPLPPYRVLTGLVDRFGRTQTFHREAAGEFSGEITGVTDGAGRHFRLVLTTQAQRAEEARQQAISGGTEPSAFPDTLPGYTEYGRDNGIRLSAVWLTHDPEYPENLPAAPLVRYTWNDNGELIRISSPRQTRSYSYSTTGRLTGVHTTAANLDIRIPYTTDPAGNRLPDPELHPDSALSMWPDNRIARDAHYLYRYDRHGRLTEKTDLIPEGVIRTDDERTHRYHYDSQHRLVHYTRTQYAEPLVESRYLYDPLGRRVAKRVWRRERDLTGWMSLSRKPQVTWYGWDGDRLTTIQNDRTRIQTIYQPGSFTPLIRVETATGELAKTQRRSLADTLQQSGGEDGGSVVFPPVLVQILDRLESEILADRVSEESRRWLASCGLTVAQMQSQMDPVYTPARKIHLYHCDHRGLPLALISTEGTTAWYAEYDEWGNLLNEENPHQLQQLIRLPGQQYDEESGLYYNRHRYYDPLQGRYITQDPIGLKGGWNFYQYPLNPISNIDPLGLETLKCIKPLHSMGGTGERSGPDIWGNPFYHQYLCVPDGKGDYTCGGQDQRGESKGDGLWGPGKASNDTKEAAGRCDLVETDNSCVENCLKGKFKEVRPRYSVLPDIFTPINLGLFKNCQDWSNDSLETCKMKCSGNNIGRFIRFVFTGVM